MPWDSFLMKKLIKNEICGSVNSARMHCSLGKVNICGYCSCTVHWTVAALLQKRVKTKKKKERKEQNAASHKRKRTLSAIQTSTKTTSFFWWVPLDFMEECGFSNFSHIPLSWSYWTRVLPLGSLNWKVELKFKKWEFQSLNGLLLLFRP